MGHLLAVESNMSNGWAKWVIGFLATLTLGSYGYTWSTRQEITVQLQRIEDKLDCALRLPYCNVGRR